MSQRTGTEEGVGAHFGLPYAPCLPARPVRDAGFSVTRLEWRLNGEANRLVSLPPDSAYFLMLYLKDAYHCDVAPDGTESETLRFRLGSVCLVDLAHGACIRLFSDLDSLAFQLPRELIREVSEFSAAPRATTLRCRRGEDDDVLRNLGAALLPLFERQGNSHTAVLQHIAIAICAHLLHAYGDHGGQGGGPFNSIHCLAGEGSQELHDRPFCRSIPNGGSSFGGWCFHPSLCRKLQARNGPDAATVATGLSNSTCQAVPRRAFFDTCRDRHPVRLHRRGSFYQGFPSSGGYHPGSLAGALAALTGVSVSCANEGRSAFQLWTIVAPQSNPGLL